MYLKSVSGKILFEGKFTNIKQGVEMAVEASQNLENINLRGANLCGAQIDGAYMPNACFWGTNLNDANMSEGVYTNADFRTANFLGSCLAEADCTNANFEGAYFARTIFTHANLARAQFSCPSLFTLDLAHVKTLEGAIYSHLGEVDCDLSHAPLIIHGLHKPLIFMDDYTIIGTDIQKIALRQHVLDAILEQAEGHKIINKSVG